MVDRVGQQLGNYQLLRLLGRGTFAEVYLAEHRYLEVSAAIKVLHVRLEPDTHEHFLREARTVAHLQHPHIVRVLDFGFQDQMPFLVMEYTPNGTLRTLHLKGVRLPLEQIIGYLKQIAPALDYAHQQRVIHRDVKPENMLLTANNEIVLSDFGIAVVQQSLDSLSTQSQAGTPVYMAPEQIQRKPCAASDQYALGVLVYEWLCGEPPFRGSLFEVLSQHLHEPPPSLCSRVPSLPQAVEDAVFGALAKDPQARFDSVQDFVDVLEEVCEATQTLSLHEPAQYLSPERFSLSDTQTRLRSTLSPEDHEHPSSASTQPLALARQHPVNAKDGVALQVPPSPAVTHSTPGRKKVPVSRSNRLRFLRRVRAFWIDGVLEHSLHGTALIMLGLQEQLDALANPWHLVLQHPNTAPRTFPLGTGITEVYDAVNGELLILGAPGSGKTTLLLELARDLLGRAEQDEQHLIPVIFNLSSWAAKQTRLTEWMIEELISKYQVPRKLARTWVNTGQILPLLDGLDEVGGLSRTACLETINTYHQEHAFLPLVIASRSADYLAQAVRIRLTSAVTIQPLTQQQVDDYLTRGGESLWALRVALHQDATMRELTETPLMLSILTLTYHDTPVENLLREGIAPTRQQIFEHYVERVLRHRGGEMRYMQEQTTHWLSWLARQMGQHGQTQFYIEQLQPTWLQKRWSRFVYHCIVVLSYGLFGGLFDMLFLALIGLIQNLISPVDWSGLWGVELGVFILGGVGGLLTGLVSRRTPTIRLIKGAALSRDRIKFGLIFGSIIGLITWLGFWFVNRLGMSVSIGGASSFSLVGQLMAGLSVGLVTTLFTILLSGLSGTKMDKVSQIRPNEGIRRSAQYGIFCGLLALLFSALIVFLFSSGGGGGGPANDNRGLVVRDIIVAIFLIIYFGALLIPWIVTLKMGIGACIQHTALRLCLWHAKSIPRNLPRFLDYAAEHILLRKVGGSYIFVHRLLLEYFASLDSTPAQDESRAQTQQAQPVP